MKKILISIVAALLLATLVTLAFVMHAQARRRPRVPRARTPKAVQAAPAPTGLALLTQPEGNVQLKRGRNTQPVKEDTLLNVGDAVTVNGKGTAVIYQAYLPVKRLRANERFDVVLRKPPPPPPARSLTPEEFAWHKTHYIAAMQNRKNPSPAVQGGTGDDSVTLLEPRNSVALSGRPTFRWSGVADATKYEVNVYTKDDAVLCTESTTKTQLALPDRCKPLAAGEYKWDVTAQIGEQVSDNSALYDATSFTVVNERRATEISAALEHARAVASGGGADAQSVHVSVLMEAKLYPQAAAELLRALEQSPNDQTLWTLLMENYARMKRWRERETARRLSEGPPSLDMIRMFAR